MTDEFEQAGPQPPTPPAPAPVVAPPPVVPEPTPSANGTVTVRVSWQVGTFISGVEGVDAITAVGTEIPASSLSAVRDAAEKSGITLEESS